MDMKRLSLVVWALILPLAGCTEEEPVAPALPTNTGTADFTRFVALGNSLTAGFQSNALSQRDQVYAFPNQIAGQIILPDPTRPPPSAMGKPDFQQPVFKDPGIGNRIRLVDLTPTFIVEQG